MREENKHLSYIDTEEQWKKAKTTKILLRNYIPKARKHFPKHFPRCSQPSSAHSPRLSCSLITLRAARSLALSK